MSLRRFSIFSEEIFFVPEEIFFISSEIFFISVIDFSYFFMFFSFNLTKPAKLSDGNRKQDTGSRVKEKRGEEKGEE